MPPTWPARPSPHPGKDAAELAKNKKLKRNAVQAWYDAAAPGRTRISNFMQELWTCAARTRLGRAAVPGVREQEPLVAAFHQGRDWPSRLKRPCRLAEFVACLSLRDDTFDSLKLVDDGMKDVPGTLLRNRCT